ncbi:MAG TPA: amidohydrolase family protein [Acidimicrobiales bacterium]|nr:amidohydrolase family protein [Acidimicrobiales bacterium]
MNDDEAADDEAADGDDPVVVVSVDSHVGPRLVEDLRPYCPSALLDDFDGYVARAAELKRGVEGIAGFLLEHPNFRTDGHHDSRARLADQDYDGVAAAVIFHGSQNFEPMPFGPLFPGAPVEDRGLAAAGMQVYDRWLADFVSAAPHRHIGVAYLPMWDVEAAIEQVAWAHDHGLAGVNFPALRAGEVLEYDDPAWDPFWAVCEERRLPLVTHVGAADNHIRYSGPGAIPIRQMESGSFFSHRAVWWLVFGGVFERFPGLRHVITETPGNWFPGLASELDAIWNMFSTEPEMNRALYETVPRPPSEYLNRNVFLGASFTSPYEAEQAVLHGFDSQLMWGSDYPHVEGTYVNPEGAGTPSVTRLALRNSFCSLAPDQIRRMVGGNAIEVYDLDRDALERVAASIGAPTIDELTTPIDAVPEGASLHAFRSGRNAWS